MMGWHHADRSTFSMHIKTVGITGEEWISASYLSLIEINDFMFLASLLNLFFQTNFLYLNWVEKKVKKLLKFFHKFRTSLHYYYFFFVNTSVSVVEGSILEELCTETPLWQMGSNILLYSGLTVQAWSGSAYQLCRRSLHLAIPKTPQHFWNWEKQTMPGSINVFPELTISLAGREKGEFEFECAPCSCACTHIHLLPKDASGSIKIPDPLAWMQSKVIGLHKNQILSQRAVKYLSTGQLDAYRASYLELMLLLGRQGLGYLFTSVHLWPFSPML